MTTGRINQVTVRQRRRPPPRANPTRDTSRHTVNFPPHRKAKHPTNARSYAGHPTRNTLAYLSQRHLSGQRGRGKPARDTTDPTSVARSFRTTNKNRHFCTSAAYARQARRPPRLHSPTQRGHWDTPRSDKHFSASSLRAWPQHVERSIGRDYATAPQGPRATQLPASTKSHTNRYKASHSTSRSQTTAHQSRLLTFSRTRQTQRIQLRRNRLQTPPPPYIYA